MEKKLPKNWVECSIGEIVSSKRGRKPSSTIDYQKDGYIPYILIDEMEGKPIRSYTNDPKVSIVNEKDVLIVWDGSIGKCGSGINGAIGSTLVALTPMAEIPTKFVEYLLIDKNSFIKQTSTGTGLQHINKDFFEICRLNLPPLAEQNRIVAKLDALFAQLETIKTSMAKVPLLLKDFRQQVLTQAVTGKLTEEWRKGKKLEPINIKLNTSIDYHLHVLPESWKHGVISNISKVKGGKRLPKGEELTTENTGYPYIRARDLKQGTVLIENLMYLEEKTQSQIKNYIVNEADLYITIVGAKIGDAGIIPKEMNGANLTENAVKITDLNENIYNKYFSLWLRSSICQSNIQQTIMSAAQGKLALTRINLLPIYLPNLKEQQEIVSRVESLFAKADTIEKQYETLKAKIDTLPQAILHKAFKGELTEQLDSDGDARELLREIEGVKEAGKTLKSKKTKSVAKKVKSYVEKDEALGMVAEDKVEYKKG